MTKAFNAQDVKIDTVSLTDYQMVNAGLAKVVIAFTGDHDKQSISQALSSKMGYLAAPVENSFRMVQAKVALGFMRANRPVRVIKSENELRANYKVMGSNIMMDQSDESLWELKNGAGGRYLARTQDEDLSNLIEASTNHRSDIPKVRNMAIASAGKREFVAFVDRGGNTDYGFCVAANTQKMRVVAHSSRSPVVIANDTVISVHQVKILRSTHNRITAKGINPADKAQSISYYKELFGYDPNYLKDIINFIETDAVA